jgi:AraC-like DNA-binding protein
MADTFFMQYITFPPPASLAMYVRAFWVLASDTAYTHRSYADGSAEMIFHYKGSFEELTERETISQSKSMIHAQSSNFRRFTTNEGFAIFGVYLYPFALPLLCNMPASELTNQMPDLVILFGNDGRILEEQMMLATNTQQRINIVSSFLEKRLLKENKSEPAIFSCINRIIHTDGHTSVKTLANTCFLSARHFERKFKAYSGFTPKLYTRIIRFQSAMKKYGSEFSSLTDIAYDCGYYDQSHFIQEFKSFSGYYPKEYFYGHAEGIEWREA